MENELWPVLLCTCAARGIPVVLANARMSSRSFSRYRHTTAVTRPLFASLALVLAPGQSVSVAIPDNSANVGGFNGPAYFYRPGIEITLNGLVSNGLATEAVSLLVADRDIHSGVPRTDQYGLTSDSFVLQGGDPWGFDTGAAFGLSQADGVFAQVTEPGTLMLFVVAIAGLAVASRLRPRKPTRPRRRV